jgi:hypothetical protein
MIARIRFCRCRPLKELPVVRFCYNERGFRVGLVELAS